jgi:hypothetical protein
MQDDQLSAIPTSHDAPLVTAEHSLDSAAEIRAALKGGAIGVDVRIPHILNTFSRSLVGELERVSQTIAQAVQSPAFTHFVSEVDRVAKAMSATADAFVPKIIGWGKMFAEAVETWEKTEREVFETLAPRGWLISPSSPMFMSSHVLRALQEQGVDEVENQLLKLYDADECERIVQSFSDRPSFSRWREKFSRAMAAHRRGEYDLAVPIWLIAVEGILSEELSRETGKPVDNIYTLSAKKNGRYIRGPFLEEELKGDWFLEGMVRVIQTFGQQASRSSGHLPVLNRHRIMHGQDACFGTEKDSVQCILLLEVIHMFVEQKFPADQ